MPSLARALLTALKDHGAQQIFGIPGDFVLPLFKVIEESNILPYFTLSHEPAVGFAADASARYHRGLGVAVVTYGAGAFNVLNSIAGAYAERSPVVVIAGGPGAKDRTSGLMLHHQARTIDTQLAVFREVTCDQAVLTDPIAAPAQIARVLRSALEQSLPVYIEFPRDMALPEVEPVVALPLRHADPGALAECADEILRRIQAASKAVVMVDVEVRRYRVEEEVADLARKLNLPVVTTFMGRGLLAHAPDVVAGTYFSDAGDPEIKRLVEEDADLVLMLGVILSDTNFSLSDRMRDRRRTILASGREVKIGFHSYGDMPLDDLVKALQERTRPNTPTTNAHGRRVVYRHGMPADDAQILPSDVATAINDLFRRHYPMPITSDIGDCLFTAMEIDTIALAAPGYYAGMGFGVPAGIGVATTWINDVQLRPLILVGDGAFQMTGWELGNCCRYGLDPIVVLFNNKSWEMLRVFQRESRFNDLDDWHFADIAASIGGVGERVTTRRELAAALDAAFKRRGKFSLVEVMLPRGATSDTLARFVAGFKSARERAAKEG
jgi:indolepyruvate decarboxylase